MLCGAYRLTLYRQEHNTHPAPQKAFFVNPPNLVNPPNFHKKNYGGLTRVHLYVTAWPSTAVDRYQTCAKAKDRLKNLACTHRRQPEHTFNAFDHPLPPASYTSDCNQRKAITCTLWPMHPIYCSLWP